MRIYDKRFPIVIISLMIVFTCLINIGYGQKNETSQTNIYENTSEGIRFQYPSYWGNLTEQQGCINGACVIGFPEIDPQVGLKFMIYRGYNDSSIGSPSCDCNTLMEYVKHMYEIFSQANGFSFINDNQTTVGNIYPAWQVEFSSLDPDGSNTKKLNVLTIVNNTLYTLTFNPFSDYSYENQLPQFKNLINSIKFLSVNRTVPKVPSFMNASEMEPSKPSLMLDNKPTALQILSHNSFTDSLGYMHVVGEIRNNSPSPATFVKITGTFYDANNQVVGTDFTYADPYDLDSGQKAPFELLLMEASVPLSQIDHYTLQPSSN